MGAAAAELPCKSHRQILVLGQVRDGPGLRICDEGTAAETDGLHLATLRFVCETHSDFSRIAGSASSMSVDACARLKV